MVATRMPFKSKVLSIAIYLLTQFSYFTLILSPIPPIAEKKKYADLNVLQKPE